FWQTFPGTGQRRNRRLAAPSRPGRSGRLPAPKQRSSYWPTAPERGPAPGRNSLSTIATRAITLLLNQVGDKDISPAALWDGFPGAAGTLLWFRKCKHLASKWRLLPWIPSGLL